MHHTPLNSSMIASAGWENGILEIEFARGNKRYQYYADETLFNELITNESPGSFFHSRIKGKLQQVTVSTASAPPPPETPQNRSGGYSEGMANEEEIFI